MKQAKTLFTLLSFLLVTLLMAHTAMAGKAIKIALDTPPDPETSATYLWSKTLADYLNANGLEVKLYPKDSLGGEAEKLDQVSQGLLEISNSDTSKAGSIDPTVNGFDLPFLFKGTDHLYRVIENSNLMDLINTRMTKKDVRLLALIPLGGESGIFTTKKFIKTPADFKGIRMRSMDKEQAKFFELLGASTVIIPWAEIYNSLQTGVADGYINPAFVPIMFKHTEVLKYYSAVNSVVSLRVAICSEDWYKKLSDKDRTLVNKGVAKANLTVRNFVSKMGKNELDNLRKAGMQIYENTDEEMAQFAELLRPKYNEFVSDEIVKLFVKIAKDNL
jgi:TRAP-type C4-dicarboxylate transport system substrate-binding protein